MARKFSTNHIPNYLIDGSLIIKYICDMGENDTIIIQLIDKFVLQLNQIFILLNIIALNICFFSIINN